MLKEEFEDTVSFVLKNDLNAQTIEKTLCDIANITGVFALVRTDTPDRFDVSMHNSGDACAIGHQIAQRDAVKTTIITPKEWHELKARLG